MQGRAAQLGSTRMDWLKPTTEQESCIAKEWLGPSC